MSDITPPVPVAEGGPTMDPTDTALPGLCQVTDVATRLMETLTDAQIAAASVFIADASALIRRYTGQQFTQGTTTDVIRLTASGDLRLKQRPVVAVDYVAVINPDGTETPIVGWWWDELDLIRTYWDGTIQVNAPTRWNDEAPSTAKVTYTHGYVTVPPEVVAVCAAVAIRRLTEPAAHLKTMRAGQYEEIYYDAQSPGSVYLTLDDKTALKDFRASSATIRLVP